MIPFMGQRQYPDPDFGRNILLVSGLGASSFGFMFAEGAQIRICRPGLAAHRASFKNSFAPAKPASRFILNPAVGFYERSGSHRWTQINTDFPEKRLSPVG
jgi:hypothetical protein